MSQRLGGSSSAEVEDFVPGSVIKVYNRLLVAALVVLPRPFGSVSSSKGSLRSWTWTTTPGTGPQLPSRSSSLVFSTVASPGPRKFLEEGGVKRHFDLEGVLQKLREGRAGKGRMAGTSVQKECRHRSRRHPSAGMRQQYPLARDIFRKFDADHDGVATPASLVNQKSRLLSAIFRCSKVLTKTEFKNALVKWGFQVTEEEALIIMKAFDSRKEPCDYPRPNPFSTPRLPGRPDQLQRVLRYPHR